VGKGEGVLRGNKTRTELKGKKNRRKKKSPGPFAKSLRHLKTWVGKLITEGRSHREKMMKKGKKEIGDMGFKISIKLAESTTGSQRGIPSKVSQRKGGIQSG